MPPVNRMSHMLNQIVLFSIVVQWGLKFYFYIHIAAFLLSWIQADPNNPIVSAINRVTIPMWNWVGRKLPRNVIAFAPITALLIVGFGELVIPGIVRSTGAYFIENFEGVARFESIGRNALYMNGILTLENIGRYLLIGGLQLMASIAWFIFLLSIIWFIFTLVNPPLNNPIVRAIWFLIDPLITPIQRLMPRSKIDFSSLVLAAIAFILSSALTTNLGQIGTLI